MFPVSNWLLHGTNSLWQTETVPATDNSSSNFHAHAKLKPSDHFYKWFLLDNWHSHVSEVEPAIKHGSIRWSCLCSPYSLGSWSFLDADIFVPCATTAVPWIQVMWARGSRCCGAAGNEIEHKLLDYFLLEPHTDPAGSRVLGWNLKVHILIQHCF